MRLAIVLLCVFASANAFAESTVGEVELTLKTAMALAIRNNLDLRVDALDSSMTEAGLHRSRGIYDPNLSMSAEHGESFYAGERYGTKDSSTLFALTQKLSTGGSLSATTQTFHSKPVADLSAVDATFWYSSVGITLTQPLLKKFGKETTELNISVAEIDHQGSLEQFRESVSDTVYAVIKGYNRLYAVRQVLESKQKTLASARQLLEKIKQRQKPSVNQDVELANTEYAISQRLKELVNAERKIRDQEAKLRYLIGEQSRTRLVPIEPPSSEEPLETTEQAIALAMEQNSDLKQLRLDLKSSELEERVAKRGQLPNLSLTASTGFRGIEDKFSDSAEQIGDGKGQWWSAGLRFSMPLGNTVAKSDYRRKQLRTKQLKNELTASEWKFRDYIEADMRALISARIQKQVADKAVASARLRVAGYRKSLLEKKSRVQDLLNAETDLVNAQNNQTEALETFANAVALLWKDTGVLLERKDVHIEGQKPEKLTAGTERISYPVSSPAQLAAGQTVTRLPATTALPLPQKDSPQLVATAVEKHAIVSAARISPAAHVKKITTDPVVFAKRAVPIQENLAEKVKSAVETAVYILKIGEYASSELVNTEKIVKKAGLVPAVTAGSKRKRQVIRLNVGDYETQAAAQKELRKLAKRTAGGFILKLGKAGLRLYAGSFFSRNSALKEQQRLVALGFPLTLEEATVQLSTALLTAGRFPSREAAVAGALKLKRLGVDAVVQKHG